MKDSVTILPDGSAFMTSSLPLPKDHWLFVQEFSVSPMPMRCGTSSPERVKLISYIRAAAKYAVRASTNNGKEIDFDPDAMVQNMIVGMLGYFTEDGVSYETWQNPSPIPPLYTIGDSV